MAGLIFFFFFLHDVRYLFAEQTRRRGFSFWLSSYRETCQLPLPVPPKRDWQANADTADDERGEQLRWKSIYLPLSLYFFFSDDIKLLG